MIYRERPARFALFHLLPCQVPRIPCPEGFSVFFSISHQSVVPLGWLVADLDNMQIIVVNIKLLCFSNKVMYMYYAFTYICTSL